VYGGNYPLHIQAIDLSYFLKLRKCTNPDRRMRLLLIAMYQIQLYLRL